MLLSQDLYSLRRLLHEIFTIFLLKFISQYLQPALTLTSQDLHYFPTEIYITISSLHLDAYITISSLHCDAYITISHNIFTPPWRLHHKRFILHWCLHHKMPLSFHHKNFTTTLVDFRHFYIVSTQSRYLIVFLQVSTPFFFQSWIPGMSCTLGQKQFF